MASRLELQAELEELLGSKNVYFQPPNTLKMKYPCIRYKRLPYENVSADNEKYLIRTRYSLTIITTDPDSTIPLDVYSHFDYCSFDQNFVSDNLYHDILTLVY